jgi:ribonuclease-3
MAETTGNLTLLQTRLGYAFADANLLQTALTHPSFRHEHPEAGADNQRLEFLGDAVLGLLLAEQLFREKPEADEGALTVLRSRCSNGRVLAEIARSLALNECLLLGRGAGHDGNRCRPSSLAAALEAILGAAWIDGGLEAARAIYARLFHDRAGALEADPWRDNPKGELQARVQAGEPVLPVYTLLAADGPEHAPRYRVQVEAAGCRAVGEGGSKQAAEKAAARAWLAAHGNGAAGDKVPDPT